MQTAQGLAASRSRRAARVPEQKSTREEMHKAIKPSPSEKDEKGIFQFLGGFVIIISKQGRSRKGGF